MKFIDVLVTCPDQEVASRIARTLNDEKLTACASIGEAIKSIYRWKGALEEANEFPLMLKTRASLFEQLSERVRSLHPYEVPCIVAMELVLVEPAYAAWLEAETRV